LGCAALLLRLLRKYPKLNSLFEWEGGAPVGGKSFNPWCADPSDAWAWAAAFWELPLLLRHYHPAVAGAAKALMQLAPGSRRQQQEGGGGNLGVGVRWA
jgi:nucleolar complex protein 3